LKKLQVGEIQTLINCGMEQEVLMTGLVNKNKNYEKTSKLIASNFCEQERTQL